MAARTIDELLKAMDDLDNLETIVRLHGQTIERIVARLDAIEARLMTLEKARRSWRG